MHIWQDHIKSLGITMKAERIDTNPNMTDELNMDHWKCKFRNKLGRKMTVYFSMGFGHNGKAPKAIEVLDCLASDAAGVDQAASFEAWASDLGYDTDSRKAEKIFTACEKNATKLLLFLGDHYDAALYDTERL